MSRNARRSPFEWISTCLAVVPSLEDLVSHATDDGQGRIARKPGIGRRALTEAERGAAAGLDDPGVAACAAEAGVGRRRAHHGRLAERVGFEPTKSFDSALFKSAAINHSATSPRERIPGPESQGWLPFASIVSRPMYGRSTSGTVTDPSGR